MSRLRLLAFTVTALSLLAGSGKPEKARQPEFVAPAIATVSGSHAASASTAGATSLVRPGSLVALSGTSRSNIYRVGSGLPAIGGESRSKFLLTLDGTAIRRKR